AVTLRDRNAVVVLEPRGVARPLAELCTVDVPTEPVSLAVTKSELLVTSAWARTLTALDVDADLARRFSVALPREPRAVAVSADGRRAFVSHVVGAKMSVVDLDGEHATRALPLGVRAAPVASGAPAERTGCQGFALATWTRGADERVFAPMVAVAPRGGEADPFGITVIGGNGYYGTTQRDQSLASPPKEAPLVSVVEGAREEPLTTTVAPLGARLGSECLLPRAAAVRASTGSLFVTCLGVDVVLELDARGKDPSRLERRRVHVAAGPTGVAIDDARGEAVVWSQFAPRLTVVPLDGDPPAQAVAIDVDYAPVGVTEAFAAGRVLFHRSADLAITRDGMACASCHPDARDDAITWTTPDGPRQTIALAGRTDGAAPYGWPGQHATLKAYIANTVSRLGGLGLGPVELDALAAYVRGAHAPHVTSVAAPAEMLARGRAIFDSQEQACSSCHVRGATDGLAHDVGSAAVGDDREAFDTPSLRFVGGSAPYFHDGRYATLDALLSSKGHTMGRAWTLDAADRRALVAYLEGL
ncbi:MAG TPA: cytochrome C peroxidase, partial [Byssovorax sp.]